MQVITRSPEETMALGRQLGQLLSPGDVVALCGPLGAGKTTFIKGIALGLGVADAREVKSPTFVLMHVYKGLCPIYHFDLYRLDSAADAEEIGLEECLADAAAITCVEWAERAAGLFPENTYWLKFRTAGPETRILEIDSLKETRHDSQK